MGDTLFRGGCTVRGVVAVAEDELVMEGGCGGGTGAGSAFVPGWSGGAGVGAGKISWDGVAPASCCPGSAA